MTITDEQHQTAIAYLGTCIPLSLHYAAACAFKPKQMTMAQFDRLYCYSYEFEEFCTITYNHLPSKWQSIVRATESPFKYQSQATELDAFYADRLPLFKDLPQATELEAFYADRLQLFKDLPPNKQEKFIGRLFNSVRDNLYAFMLSITSVDAMRVKQSGVEHELTILHHQMWETVREAMKPGLYFIADCQ